jgi:hypothetical protein
MRGPILPRLRAIRERTCGPKGALLANLRAVPALAEREDPEACEREVVFHRIFGIESRKTFSHLEDRAPVWTFARAKSQVLADPMCVGIERNP